MPKLLKECTFYSDTKKEEAGRILLYEENDGSGKLVRESFTSELTLHIPREDVKEIETLISKKDARSLFEYDSEITPFYCPECDKIYSKSEWTRLDAFDDDDWHDSIRGICPSGHERMLED